MCRWMGSHFLDWIDHNGVANFRIFGVRQFFLFTVSKRTRMFVLLVKTGKVFFIQFKYGSIHKKKVTKLGSQKLHICPKVTKMGSIIGHKIDYNGVEALRRQRHVRTQQKFIQVPPTPPPRNRRMNRNRSFAVRFDKLSWIEWQSRPKYKSAVPNWFVRRTLHVPNLIRFGICKVRRLIAWWKRLHNVWNLNFSKF